MGEVEVKCPHCGKKTKAKWDNKKPDSLQGLKEGSWFPLLTTVAHNLWTEDWRRGIAVFCKCGRPYFVYNLLGDTGTMVTDVNLRDGSSVTLFCASCGAAFNSPSFECPGCHTRYK